MKVAFLFCLLAAAPAFAQTPPSPPLSLPPARLVVSQTVPDDALDPRLAEWFARQDRVLDDILSRLARIEILVEDIRRLVVRMPDMAAPRPPRPTSAVPAPPPPRDEAAGLPRQWLPQLVGGLAGVLLLVWLVRRRASKREASVSTVPQPTPPAMPPQPTAAPAPPDVSEVDFNIDSGQADQALELAEIMLSMGLGHGAAQTLAEQIRSEPKQALRHWLKLLEIYRSNGQQAEFERSAEELRQHFNVKPEDWQLHPAARHSVEEYPHIARRLTELWRTPACLIYVQNLLADNRGGARAGFPQAVAEELLLLAAMLRNEGISA